jgi:hypothetical protein
VQEVASDAQALQPGLYAGHLGSVFESVSLLLSVTCLSVISMLQCTASGILQYWDTALLAAICTTRTCC